ncbi:hypothetical protein JZU48_00505 [bacterium]|nr:hypothetical protein [bacterium]
MEASYVKEDKRRTMTSPNAFFDTPPTDLRDGAVHLLTTVRRDGLYRLRNNRYD